MVEDDRRRPRHVDRRDQGIRRQRAVTQGAAFGAAALAVAFGWAFAQPEEAAGTTTPSSTTQEDGTTQEGGTQQEAGLQAPDQAPAAQSGTEGGDARSGGS
ncbi:hypothetical protein WEI85_30755 [Actinomycetes bacterium KLBMP 9797]